MADVYWKDSQVLQDERARLLGQSPVTLWLTGLSGSGKSTLAFTLERRLADLGRSTYVLDGDNVRHGLCRDLGFSMDDRRENIRRVAEVARLMNDAGLIVVAAFISPMRADRLMAREIVGASRFFEVHLDAPIEVCEQRDPKGLYGKARQGSVAQFTGLTSPYEPPEFPELILHTDRVSVEEAVERLLTTVVGRLSALV